MGSVDVVMGGALTAGVAAGSDFAEEPGVGELHLGVAPPLDLGSQDGGISDLCTSWGAISHNKEIPAEIRYASRGSCQDGLAMHRKHGGWECGEAGGRRSIAAGGTLDPNDEAAHHDGARGGESEVSSHGEAGLPGQSKVFSTYISLWPFGKIEIYVEEDPEPRRRKMAEREEKARRAIAEKERRRQDATVCAKEANCKRRRLAAEMFGTLLPCKNFNGMYHWMLAKSARLRNSKELIGWLKQKGRCWITMDVTADFEECLTGVCNDTVSLPREYDYLFVPGYLWKWFLSSQYFAESVTTFNDHGLDAFFADQINSTGTVAANADLLVTIIKKMHAARGKQIVLIGHSKGALDCLAAVAKYRTELAPLVRGIVCLQAPIAGSPIASDLVYGTSIMAQIIHIAYRILGWDIESLKDLTHANRKQFFTEWGQHWPVRSVPVLCFSSAFQEGSSRCTVSQLLKAPEMYMMMLYGAVSDGVVTAEDSELPGTMVVRARGGLSHVSTILDTPKGGINMNGASAAVWQINTAAIAAMLSASSGRRAAGWGGASHLAKWIAGAFPSLTTEDMANYEPGRTTNSGGSMRRIRSEECFRLPGGLPRHAKRGMGAGNWVQLEATMHYGRCTSDVSEDFLARADEATGESIPLTNSPPGPISQQKPSKMELPPPPARKMITRGQTVSEGEFSALSRQRSNGKVGRRGCVSDEVWMKGVGQPKAKGNHMSSQAEVDKNTPCLSRT